MKKSTIIVAAIGLTLFFILFRCERSSSEADTLKNWTNSDCQKLIKEIMAPVTIRENTVVFLFLSRLEYDIQPRDLQFELIEIVDDFSSYVERAVVKLGKYKIASFSTISKNLIFKYPDGRKERLSFDTSKYPVAVALFGNGKGPIIHYGIVLEDDILKAASEYFEIEIK